MTDTELNMRDVLFRDDCLLGINKPPGVPVHGSRILEDTPATVLSMVRKLEGRLSHVVHRLDRPVSGVLLFAASREVLAELAQQFESRHVKKRYLAVVRGWTGQEDRISHALLPPRDERKAGSVAREAVTRYQCIARAEIPVAVPPYQTARYSLLSLCPETGRRHQLRMHMKHISHPLAGDTTYGRGEHNRMFREAFDCHRLLLHAWSLEFDHPASGQRMQIQAPLDAGFSRVIAALGWSEALAAWADAVSAGAAAAN
jgi:tRNA pseudouridine65 synthase